MIVHGLVENEALAVTKNQKGLVKRIKKFIDFLENNPSIKGVIASGDTGYGEAYCLAGDKISEDYHVPCIYKVENDGTDDDVEAIKELL